MSNTAIGINNPDSNKTGDSAIRFDFCVNFKPSNRIRKEVNEAAIVAMEIKADRGTKLGLDSDVRIARGFT